MAGDEAVKAAPIASHVVQQRGERGVVGGSRAHEEGLEDRGGDLVAQADDQRRAQREIEQGAPVQAVSHRQRVEQGHAPRHPHQAGGEHLGEQVAHPSAIEVEQQRELPVQAVKPLYPFHEKRRHIPFPLASAHVEHPWATHPRGDRGHGGNCPRKRQRPETPAGERPVVQAFKLLS